MKANNVIIETKDGKTIFFVMNDIIPKDSIIATDKTLDIFERTSMIPMMNGTNDLSKSPLSSCSPSKIDGKNYFFVNTDTFRKLVFKILDFDEAVNLLFEQLINNLFNE